MDRSGQGPGIAPEQGQTDPLLVRDFDVVDSVSAFKQLFLYLGGKRVDVSGRFEKGDTAVHGNADLVVGIARIKKIVMGKSKNHASVTETKPVEHVLFNTHRNPGAAFPGVEQADPAMLCV